MNDNATNLLTASRLSAWSRCPRLHHHRYEEGVAPIEDPHGARAFGTAVHRGLEEWWSAWQSAGGYGALGNAVFAARESFDGADDYEAARLEAMLAAYDARWSRWAATVEVLGVELPFRAPLCHPVSGKEAHTWQIAGKLDLLVRLDDGRVAIVEHKTTSRDASAGSDYRRRLTLDAQIGMYFEGAEALGYNADLCVYDVLGKPQQEPLAATPVEARKYTKAGKLYATQREQSESPAAYQSRLIDALSADPDRYLVHAEIVRSAPERALYQHDLWETVHAIEHQRRRVAAGATPPRHVTGCMAHGRCDFLEVCEGTARTDDPTRFRRLPVVHPELPTEITQTPGPRLIPNPRAA